MSETFRTYDESYPPSLWATPPPLATGATAGTPGQWTPTGSTPPANAAGATGIVASPATDWTIGQYVQGSTAGAAGEMNWSGTAWVAGRSAVAGDQALDSRESAEPPVETEVPPETPTGGETAAQAPVAPPAAPPSSPKRGRR